MNNRYSQILIVLDRPEMDALMAMAETNLRRPKDQAHHILRSALLGEHLVSKNENRHDELPLESRQVMTVAQ